MDDALAKGSEPGAERQALWRLNERCNLRCSYCFRKGLDEHRGREHPACGRLPPGRIADAFAATGAPWRIHLTGGEPFLYPGFVDLAVALTARQRLSVNTNLTCGDVAGFGARVDPARVHSINATLHREQLESRGLTERWLENFLALQARGFPIRLVHLTEPSGLAGAPALLRSLRERGVRRVYVKIFRGPAGGRSFPEQFDPAERASIETLGLTPHEARILRGEGSFLGRPCRAGMTAFDLDLLGNLKRCSTIRTPHGNLFEGRFRPDPRPLPCPAERCACPYQGLHFAQQFEPAGGALGLVRRVARSLLRGRLPRGDVS